MFFGSRDPKLSPDPGKDAVDRGARNIDAFLRWFAHVFTDYSDLYNAAKHGLAVRPGDSMMKLHGVDGIEAAGTSIEYLTLRQTPQRRVWARTTTWVEIDRSIAMIWMGLRLMKGLWTTAQVRYGQASLNDHKLDLFLTPTFDETLKHSRDSVISVDRMSVDLSYFKGPRSGV